MTITEIKMPGEFRIEMEPEVTVKLKDDTTMTGKEWNEKFGKKIYGGKGRKITIEGDIIVKVK